MTQASNTGKTREAQAPKGKARSPSRFLLLFGMLLNYQSSGGSRLTGTPVKQFVSCKFPNVTIAQKEKHESFFTRERFE